MIAVYFKWLLITAGHNVTEKKWHPKSSNWNN